MKKTLMTLGVLAALSMVFVGCDQPTTTEDATGGSSSTPTTSGASATPTDDSTATDTGSGTGSASTTTGSGTQTSGDSSSSGGEEAAKLTKTSILAGIQVADDVWGSGTKITSNDNGTYTATSGTGWDASGMASIPTCFDAGDLVGYTHIVVELDTTNFNFRDDSEQWPSYELKVEKPESSKGAGDSIAKTIGFTKLFKEGVAEIPLSSVDFLDTAKQVCVNLRGTGTVIVKDISKAK